MATSFRRPAHTNTIVQTLTVTMTVLATFYSTSFHSSNIDKLSNSKAITQHTSTLRSTNSTHVHTLLQTITSSTQLEASDTLKSLEKNYNF